MKSKKLKKTELRCVVCDGIFKDSYGEWAYHKRVQALHCVSCASRKKINRLIEDAENRILTDNFDADDILSILLGVKILSLRQAIVPRSPRSR